MGKNKKVIEVNNLSVSFKTPNGLVRAVRDISFELYEGETLAIVGESGSGKSVTNRAIMGILAGNAVIDNGEILYNHQDLTKLSEQNFHTIRGNKIGMIFQDPLSALNPIMRIGKQITEAMLVNGDRIKNKYQSLYHKEYHNYLNAISKIKFLIKQRNLKLYEVKTDLSLDRQSKNAQLAEIKDKYKKEIQDIKALEPDLKKAYLESKAKAKLVIKEESEAIHKEKDEALVPLKKNLEDAKAKYLEIAKDAKNIEALKRSITKVEKQIEKFDQSIASLQEIIDAKGTSNEYEVKLASVKAKKEEAKAHLQNLKNDLLQVAENDAKFSEIKRQYDDARKAVKDTLETYKRKFKVTKREAYERAIKIMTEVGIPEPQKRFNQYPFQFSGGMRQRIVIATALTIDPEILICDEPTTALDVTIQEQILNLIKDIKKERNLSVIFITHDLGVVANMADRVAVMYAGKIVEYGTLEDIFYDPKHPYTWALLSSVPDLETTERLLSIPGTPPDMLFPPKGDAFAERNQFALKIDFEEEPPFFQVSDTHFAKTWLLHPQAPKIDMPEIVSSRIQKYRSLYGSKKPTDLKVKE